MREEHAKGFESVFAEFLMMGGPALKTILTSCALYMFLKKVVHSTYFVK